MATLAPTDIYDCLAEMRWISASCREINDHERCDFHDRGCSCTCHTLDNTKIGWLVPEVTPIISGAFPEFAPNDDGWFCAATVLAPFWCGLDEVRIMHAIGWGCVTIHHAAHRLREAGIWNGDTWYAMYVEPDYDAWLVELTCHVLVAQGLLHARKENDEFQFQACKPPLLDIGVRKGTNIGRSAKRQRL